MGNIGVLIEINNGSLKKINKEALSLAKSSGNDVYAIVFSNNIDSFSDEFKGIKTIINIKTDMDDYKPDNYAATLSEIIKKYSLNDFIAGYTSLTRDMLPRVAAKLNGTLVNDCIEIDLENRTIVKPIYAGKLLQQYKLKDEYNLYSIRSNVFKISDLDGNAPNVEEFELINVDELTKINEVIKDDSGNIDVVDAEIIISGGRGMGSKENFEKLFDLATILKAGVGASRAAVDAEYASANMQVGQTGKVVNPKLYLAFGISGAIQHFVGMKTSKVIVAINKDADAPIFKKADYGIIGDLFTVLPLLKEELSKID